MWLNLFIGFYNLSYHCYLDHTYRIIIVNGKEAHASTSAKCWLRIIGSHASSEATNIPQETDIFEFSVYRYNGQ